MVAFVPITPTLHELQLLDTFSITGSITLKIGIFFTVFFIISKATDEALLQAITIHLHFFSRRNSAIFLLKF